MDTPLDPVAVRVLGSLVEKESTTPDNYPLTLNALTAACNQTTNRDPVMQVTESEVAASLDELTRRKLVREVYRSDSRVKRWRHTLVDTISLHQPELAALCVLMLRGPQTTGEIRTRAARLFEFIELKHVEITLDSLMTMDPPLAVQLPRRSGQKETRYAHLLSGPPEVDMSEPEPSAEPRRGDRVTQLEQEVATLRAELAGLRARLDAFEQQFQ